MCSKRVRISIEKKLHGIDTLLRLNYKNPLDVQKKYKGNRLLN